MKIFCKSKSLILLTCLVFLINLSPEQRLSNELQEQRAMNLFLQVRCLVCNGQVIENSDTEFAFEMRKNIRNKIAEGKSDKQIEAELKREFGDDILTKPNGKVRIFLLIAPIIFAALILLLLLRL